MRILYKILSFLSFGIVYLLKCSYRFRYVDEHHRDEALKISSTGAYLYSMWHQNTVAGIIGQWGRPHQILLSRSKDGDLIEYSANRMNYVCVRGSSSKGGREARTEMIEGLKRGLNAAITPDGPRGPAKVVKNGIIDMARATGSSILPMSCVAEQYWSFRSWDQFRLPKPFTKIIVRYGKPLLVPESTTNEQFDEIKNKLAAEMNRCEEMLSIDLQNT